MSMPMPAAAGIRAERRGRGAARGALAVALAVGAAACATTHAGVYHRVSPGETLFRIAVTYKVDPAELAQANRLADPTRIEPGQELFVPGATELRDARWGSRPGEATAAASRKAKDTPRNTPKAVAARERTATAKGGTRAAADAPVEAGFVPATQAEPDPRGGCPDGEHCPVIWPVNGVVTSLFGKRWDRMHKGIDISAPEGSAVVASCDGEVVFSAAQRGYGDLILLRSTHGGIITVYAHLQARLVEQGDKVRQGQVIARVGRTGHASGPHLHFEIRKGTSAVDPLRLLPKRDSFIQAEATAAGAAKGG